MPLQLDSLHALRQLLAWDALQFLLPAMASCAAIVAAMRAARNPLVLPAVLAAIPLGFHIVLKCTGHSLAQAQDAGWVQKPEVRAEP